MRVEVDVGYNNTMGPASGSLIHECAPRKHGLWRASQPSQVVSLTLPKLRCSNLLNTVVVHKVVGDVLGWKVHDDDPIILNQINQINQLNQMKQMKQTKQIKQIKQTWMRRCSLNSKGMNTIILKPRSRM